MRTSSRVLLGQFWCAVLFALPTIVTHAAGGPGYALSFDGDDDRVEAELNAFSNVVNSFTIELWVNPTGSRDEKEEVNTGISFCNQRFAVFPDIGDRSYGTNDAGAGLSIGTNGISVYEHATNYLPSLLVLLNHAFGLAHVALVYVDRTPQLYVNGNYVPTGLKSTNAFVHPSASLGGSIEGIGYGNYQGQLDEVRIWDTSLSPAEIQANMNRTLTGDEPNLAVYFRCDEGTGLALTDHSEGVGHPAVG